MSAGNLDLACDRPSNEGHIRLGFNGSNMPVDVATVGFRTPASKFLGLTSIRPGGTVFEGRDCVGVFSASWE
jgi:hypothetical protein